MRTNTLTTSPARLVVLISGSGTTLQNINDHIIAGKLDAVITGVISSRADAYGLIRATNMQLPSTVIARRDIPEVAAYSDAIFSAVETWHADLVIMAGFLALLKIPPRFENRVLNIHPALLPHYGGRGMHGARVHQAVIDAGEPISGCTVHYADNQYDHGPIILQRICPVLPGDTAATLAARVFEQECIAYPEAIQKCITTMRQVP